MSLFTNLWILLPLKVILLRSNAKGAARFTVVPPSVLYVSSGGTARFVWDYSVDNRFDEFDVFSPKWSFYDVNDKDHLICHQNVWEKRKWLINIPTCPARLLNPTRVSKESNATLVIHNVTMADSGTYGCTLVLTTGNPITSKAQLVVTTRPHFTLKPMFPIASIYEYQDLSINCSATGSPQPNITWVKVKGLDKLIKSQGVENLTMNIPNITRHDSGIYKCCAANNPNEELICKNTTVIVMYKPEIDNVNSSNAIPSFNGNTISLRCLADGQPPPLITWYDPHGRQKTSEIRNISGGIALKLTTDVSGQYGSYKCKATNMVGHDEHVVNVTEIVTPTKPRKHENRLTSTSHKGTITKETTADEESKRKKDVVVLMIGAAVMFVLIIIIVILVVMIWMKFCRSKDSKEQPRSNDARAEEKDTPIYAQVDFSKKQNRKKQKETPIYAQVDKSKKKRPGQIIYTELGDLKLNQEVLSVISPSSCSSKDYAEINFHKNGNNSEPIYEIC